MNDETLDDAALAARPKPEAQPATGDGPAAAESDGYDFGGACFDLDSPADREILRFILSQALYGESTGVYCGRSLYSARSLEAARFYVRQARQELAHLELFADILRALELEPLPPHPLLRMLAAHNNYYPLKVLMEHAVGEGMVLDVFKDLLLQTLPDADPRVASIKKKLRVVVREEAEHVAWGEKETRYVLDDKPWLREPFMGLVELQLAALPWLVERLGRGNADHPVLKQLVPFVKHVQARVRAQGKRLGFYPEQEPRTWQKGRAIGLGLGVYALSQFWPSRSTLDKSYLRELGFEPARDASARTRRS
ncbi:MAG: ferritin-like domain-containing protein [Polyangiaceae bacterium]